MFISRIVFHSQQSNLTCHTLDLMGSQMCGFHCPAAMVNPPSSDVLGHRYIINTTQPTLTIRVLGQNSSGFPQYQPAMWCNWFVDAPANRTILFQFTFLSVQINIGSPPCAFDAVQIYDNV